MISLKNYSNISDVNKKFLLKKYSNIVDNNENHYINKIQINENLNINKTIIYISRHDGTIANFKTIGELLNFNVSVLTPTYEFEEGPPCFREDKCKTFVKNICSSYDYVVISDVIPDSYPFLINDCNTKIILEITNRFDLFVPDDNKVDYYKNFGAAIINNKNITVVENNPYEVFFACQQGIFIPNYYLIRPAGFAPYLTLLQKNYEAKHEHIAIIARTDQDIGVTSKQLKFLKIKYRIFNKNYGGPLVLANYKALLILPYEVSIMKMMENFRYGVVMLIPTERLFRELSSDNSYEFKEKNLKNVTDGLVRYTEWYNTEFRDLFVYFDHWEELPDILNRTDFSSYRKKEMDYIKKYEQKAFDLWAQVLDLKPSVDMIRRDRPNCDNDLFFNYEL